MVVGYDEVKTQLLCASGFIYRGDAAVHGYDQRGAAGFYRIQRSAVQAVALLQPVGYVRDAGESLLAQPAGNQAGGGYSVHVIVAVHGDGLALVYGLADSRHGLGHVRHSLRRVEQLLSAVYELSRRLRLGYPPPRQHGREQGREPRRHQRLRNLRLRTRYYPVAILHLRHPYLKQA